MFIWAITQGSRSDQPVQLVNRGGRTYPVFVAVDSFTAHVYAGQAQPSLFSPAVTWYTAGGLQTGYDQGQVLVDVTPTQSALMTPNAIYQLEIWWDQQTARVGRCMVRCEGTAGTDTRPIVPYCTYKDMLDRAPWVAAVQDLDADQAEYYSQRVQARKWLDDLIISSWQGTSYAPFGSPGFPASLWSGGWSGRTPLTSQWLRDRLAGGSFMPQGLVVTAAGTGYTQPPTATLPSPSGVGVQATLGVNLTPFGGVASVYPIVGGSGYTPSTSYPITFTGGNGTGAQAVATSTPGALMIREQIVRISAWKAIGIVGTGQIGSMNQYSKYGYMFTRMADDEALNSTVELDVNYDGVADTPIVLGTANVFWG